MTLEIIIPIIAVIVAWYLNERSKRKFEEYKRKEESYRKLLLSARGFYIATNDNDLKMEFINELNICWLYAPDEVIKEGNNFLFKLIEDNINTQEAERSLKKLIEEIRKDIISRKLVRKTNLSSDDIRLFSVN